MSVTFANVSAVNIPQGDVTKITETSTGRILWQKPSGDYPLCFICAETSRGNFTTTAAKYVGSGYTTVSRPTNLSVNTVAVNSYIDSGGFQRSGSYVSSGNKFSACYVTNSSEASNVPTSAKTLSDATWAISDFYLIPLSSYTLQGQFIQSTNVGGKSIQGIKLSTSQRPVSFSSLSGGTITASSVASNIDNYNTIYESYSGDSRYVSVSAAPYLYGSFQLSYTSETYRNLIGASNHNYSPTMVFFFILYR